MERTIIILDAVASLVQTSVWTTLPKQVEKRSIYNAIEATSFHTSFMWTILNASAVHASFTEDMPLVVAVTVE
jgi:hypothetical protein